MHIVIDDSPGKFTRRILDALLAEEATASFGVIGAQVEGHEHLLERMVDEGHAIVNHTMNHAALDELTPVQIAHELFDCQDAIEDACGFVPTALRPPFVRYDQRVLEVAEQCGFSEVLLTPSVGDYESRDPKDVVRRCLAAGDFIGLHDIKVTAHALPEVLASLKVAA